MDIIFTFWFPSFTFPWDAAYVVHMAEEPILVYSQSKRKQVQP